MDGGPIYYQVDGDTMTEMLQDGLRQTGTNDIRMKLALLALVLETTTIAMERRL